MFVETEHGLLADAGPSEGSISPLKVFAQCQRKYYLKFEWPRLRGYDWKEYERTHHAGDALVKGAMAHAGLGQHYLRVWARQNGRDPSIFVDPIYAVELASAEWHTGAKFTRNIQLAVASYVQDHAMESVQVLHVEQPFSYSVGPYTYTQKPDLVVKNLEGKICPWDHKTTGSLSNALFTYYALDIKILSVQWWGPKLYGDQYGGFYINALGLKPPYKTIRKTPDPAPDALRHFESTVLRLEEQRAECLTEQGLLLEEGKDPAGAWPLASHELVCYTRYGRCEYWEDCRWGRSQTTETALGAMLEAALEERTPPSEDSVLTVKPEHLTVDWGSFE